MPQSAFDGDRRFVLAMTAALAAFAVPLAPALADGCLPQDLNRDG